MDWNKATWDEYRDFKEEFYKGQEYARKLREEELRKKLRAEKEKRQASIDPMQVLANFANSTHSVGEHVWFDNGWGVYIQRKEGERMFKLTQIRPGNTDALHYTQLTPVLVIREMYKVSQYA